MGKPPSYWDNLFKRSHGDDADVRDGDYWRRLQHLFFGDDAYLQHPIGFYIEPWAGDDSGSVVSRRKNVHSRHD